MTTPPRVDDARAAELVQAIVERHLKADDPNAHLIGEHPVEVLAYLRKHSSGLPDEVRRADVEDALDLTVWLRWLVSRTELWILDRAKRLDMNRRQVGAHLGIRSGQGVVDRRDRLRAMLADAGPGRPDEKAGRVLRRSAEPADAVKVWLRRNRAEVLAVSRALLALEFMADDDAAEFLVDVRRDVADGVCTPASVEVLRWAVEAMSEASEGCSAEATAELAGVVYRWSLLAAEWRAAGR